MVLPDGGAKRKRKKMRMFRHALPLLAAGVLAACSQETQDTPATLASEGEAVPSPVPSRPPSALPVAARAVSESNELYEFEYTYPAAAGAIPGLKAMLDADIEKRKAALIADAKEQQAMAKKDGFPYRTLSHWVTWKVVTDLPGWLSLSAEISTYEGGAHPNHGFDALVWDRQAEKARDPLDMFRSKEALSATIRRDFCAALNRERSKKRGAPVPPGSTDGFDECIDPVENTVILGSTNGQAFDRIGVLVAPYAAGPYAEGDYEVTLPVTNAMLDTVKRDYRATFVATR
jgi:hypothetical protein